MKLYPDNIIFCDGCTEGKPQTEHYAFVVLTKDGRWIERCNKRVGRKDGRQLHEFLAVEKAYSFHKKYLEGFTVIYSDDRTLRSAVYGNGKFFEKERPFKSKTTKLENDKTIKIRGIQHAPSPFPYKWADLFYRRKQIVQREYQGFPPYFNVEWISSGSTKQIQWREFENYFLFYQHCYT